MNEGYVYAYIFDKHNTVYVGWTNNPIRRDRQHRKYRFVRHQKMYRFLDENSLELPSMKILYEAPKEAYEYGIEEMFIKAFRNNGWYVLNVDKGHGSSSMYNLKRLDVCMSFVDGIVYSQRPIRIKTKQKKAQPNNGQTRGSH